MNSAMITAGWRRHTPEELAKLFRVLGKESTGTVSLDEFYQILSLSIRREEILDQVRALISRS